MAFWEWLPIEIDFSLSWGMLSDENFEERGLSATVCADNRHDLAFVYWKVDVFEDLGAFFLEKQSFNGEDSFFLMGEKGFLFFWDGFRAERFPLKLEKEQKQCEENKLQSTEEKLFVFE